MKRQTNRETSRQNTNKADIQTTFTVHADIQISHNDGALISLKNCRLQ